MLKEEKIKLLWSQETPVFCMLCTCRKETLAGHPNAMYNVYVVVLGRKRTLFHRVHVFRSHPRIQSNVSLNFR